MTSRYLAFQKVITKMVWGKDFVDCSRTPPLEPYLVIFSLKKSLASHSPPDFGSLLVVRLKGLQYCKAQTE